MRVNPASTALAEPQDLIFSDNQSSLDFRVLLSSLINTPQYEYRHRRADHC